MTVAGAARSGIAAAELLARRGARVTLSESHAEAPGTEPLLALGVHLELGGHRTETFTGADLVVLSPGVPPEQEAVQAARARGVPVIAEIELASRWLQGRVIAITGTKGKSTTTALTGTDARSGGIQGDRRRQHRRAAERPGVDVDARDPARRRDEQLSARADRRVPSVDRGDAEFLARSSRSASGPCRLRRRQGPHLREPGRGRLGGDQRRRSRGAGAGAAGQGDQAACSRGERADSPKGRSSKAAGLSIGGRAPTGVSCRSTRFICSDRISSATSWRRRRSARSRARRRRR